MCTHVGCNKGQEMVCLIDFDEMGMCSQLLKEDWFMSEVKDFSKLKLMQQIDTIVEETNDRTMVKRVNTFFKEKCKLLRTNDISFIGSFCVTGINQKDIGKIMQIIT